MKVTDQEIARALKKERGKIYLAAARLGCTSKTVHAHINKNPDLKQIIDDYRSKMVDKAEKKLEEAIEAGEHWAIALCLRTLGKDRGYVERQEVEASANIKMYGQEAPIEEV